MAKSKQRIFLLSLVFIVVGVTFFSHLEACKNQAHGIVFEDTNQNGKMDTGEPGIAGVAVSNQRDVVLTNKQGEFQLPVDNETIIFISKPSAYDTPLDEHHLPHFYYLHYPQGSHKEFKETVIAPTGPLPATIYFPLVKRGAEQKEDETINAIIMGDPQTKTMEEVGYLRDQVVTKLLNTNVDFYLDLGDLAYDAPSLYPAINKVLAKVGVPIYHVMGNHDMNYKALDYKHEGETFKQFYGPDYYSFNYGKVHVVVLNTIKYDGWDPVTQKKKTEYGYTGGLHAAQLSWLQQDLSFVPADYLVVLTMHIPPASRVNVYDVASSSITNAQELYKILENRRYLLALAGHMHYFEYFQLNASDGWQGPSIFPCITAGSACGTWWHGVKDANGLPIGIAVDGSPNGFFKFAFTGTRYQYQFVPARPFAQDQLRINSPTGIIDKQVLPQQRIEVNVFAGTPDTRVSFSLDGKPGVAMERKIMEDSFYKQLLKENPAIYLDWMVPTPCTHLWEAPLPVDLTPGVHRLDVSVHDSQGNQWTEQRLFEIQ